MKKKKVIHINAIEQTVTETSVESLEDCQKLVGGLIERVCILENGDEVYANEEGLLCDPQFFFTIKGHKLPIAGNGYVIGAADGEGDNQDVKSTANEIRAIVQVKKRIPMGK